MATLCLGDVDCSTPVLRDWLSGDWALLFSHPDDFQYRGLEDDRWLEILLDEFRARGVRPLACARTAADADVGWVSQLICDQRFVRLGGDTQANEEVVDLSARTLRADILSLPSRFVLIVDELLKRRGVLKYHASNSQVSPLDLLASVRALRRKNSIPKAA